MLKVIYTYKLQTKQSDSIFKNTDLKVIGKAMPVVKFKSQIKKKN